MYAGTTITRGSGRIIGTHQKIDRVARRRLQPYIPRGFSFPLSREILRFEGLNGPDGIKKKSPSKDEPWHYINPDDPNDRELLGLIAGHEKNLIKALCTNNREKAAFEAAWLAHAIVDGLTPAHHYPYKEKRDALMGDWAEVEALVPKKIWLSGDKLHDKLKNSYEFYKPNGRGVGSAHLYFELGVTTTAAPLRFTDVRLSAVDRASVRRGGVVPLYMDKVEKVHAWRMYDTFLEKGWTSRLAKRAKNDLMPLIIHTVLMSWYYCLWKATHDET